jgi:hypothetical protein
VVQGYQVTQDIVEQERVGTQVIPVNQVILVILVVDYRAILVILGQVQVDIVGTLVNQDTQVTQVAAYLGTVDTLVLGLVDIAVTAELQDSLDTVDTVVILVNLDIVVILAQEPVVIPVIVV